MKYSFLYLFTLLIFLSCEIKEKNENIVAHWSLDGNFPLPKLISEANVKIIEIKMNEYEQEN